MATRGAIGIQIGDKIHGIYSHFDNYLDGTGTVLFNYYDRNKTLELIEHGDVSCINKDVDKCEFYHRDRGEDKDSTCSEVFDSVSDFLKYYKNDYMYYMDQNNTWWVSEWGRELKTLETELSE